MTAETVFVVGRPPTCSECREHKRANCTHPHGADGKCPDCGAENLLTGA